MLTQKQRQLLIFINEKIHKTGTSPSYEEMKSALSLKSKSGIHRLINGLEERGFLKRLPNRARALEVLRNPTDASLESLKSNDKSNNTNFSVNEINIPLYGKIAAGSPIEAISDLTNSISIPSSMLSVNSQHFALEVSGDSMIEAGILDGDIALIRKCDIAENGDIVVALIDEEEATLKRFRKKGKSIALEPANKSFETRIFGPNRLRIQGCMAGLMRSY